ncbi:hypothetical protein LTR78_007918 [Recurvomyces mirabilis]|uniref:Helicase C-terminal domain-containing protein n=1 Tax=Recurvomyces mirabilis TaxID=574656 RepID=A0AAE0WHW3_9PEZI|nr:hypothetical protein LTR78_007918 [Recurvomyces mirabilis]KAK5152453.1 hypothetical protein LTS14_008400 [Recurvomyces mirabilis]
MVSQHVGRKRKAASPSDEDGYESDCILVAPSGHKSSAKINASSQSVSRSPLQEIHQNKRRRTVECVLIPRQEALKLFRTANTAASDQQKSIRWVSTAFNGSAHKRSGQTAKAPPIKDSRQISIASLWKPASLVAASENVQRAASGRQQTTGTETLRADTTNAEQAATTSAAFASRARRGTTRVSYASHLADLDSEEEVMPKRILKAQRRRDLDDEDYEHDIDMAAADEPESPSSDDADVSERSDAGPSESDAEVEVPPGKKHPSQAKTTKVTESKAGSTSNSEMKSLLTRPSGTQKGLDSNLPPLSDIRDIFADETKSALGLGLRDALLHLDGRALRVATMCSGTESPLLALQMIADALRESGEPPLNIEHVFSAEIVPYKQAYIERNFAPPVIFRDVTEFPVAFQSTGTPVATTAYGSKVAIPLHADIVIAGTSCVDYSTQNNKKKGINDGGESGQTWFGALAYCKAVRPAIIIFENVIHAHWNQMLKYYRDIGYVCEGVKVDTKDYYLPQTRQRGYMVCFDQKKLPAKKIAQGQWQDHMQNMKRLASSPISDFMMNTNDLHQHTRPQARDDDQQREVDWSACELRHVQHRAKEKLGAARPFTRWQEGGSMAVPENGSNAWFTKQVDRVKDTIEGTHLSTARKYRCDPRYKTLLYNLSQNVDRIPVAGVRSLGLIGCILPTSIPYVTDSARVLTAHENLKLQGIPLDRIILGSETPAELLDLAGNAMSSTVVGAALLSALLVGYRLVESDDKQSTADLTSTTASSNLAAFGEASAEGFDHRHEVLGSDLEELLKKADSSARKCSCEGNYQLSRKPIQQCAACNHTTCIACGGNPKHEYRPNLELSSSIGRIWPSSFEDLLRAKMPLQVQFDLHPDLHRLHTTSALNQKQHNPFVTAAEVAFASTFGLQRIQRSYNWRMIYSAEKARLELAIGDNKIEWQLFALPDQILAMNHPLRLALAHPIARGAVKDALLSADWQMCIPADEREALEICPSKLKVPSWWARLGLPDDAEHIQPQSLEVKATSSAPTTLQRELCGTYTHLPKCGNAADSLYVKGAETGERSVYCFCDPTRTGDPNEDEFVFSYDHERLDYDERRTILARVKAPWRPWSSPESHAGKAVIYTDIELVRPASLIALRPGTDTVNVRRARRSLEDSVLPDCKIAPCLIQCTLPSNGENLSSKKTVLITEDKKLLTSYAWVFEVMRRHMAHDTWQKLPLQMPSCACQECAPIRPELLWRLDHDGKTVKSYEDPASAAAYERAIKAQKHRMAATITHTDSGEAIIDFGINVLALAHIAASRLPHDASKVDITWRLETGCVSLDYKTPPFALTAVSDMEPTPCSFEDGRELFPEQQRALSWMQKQEHGVEIHAEEAEEAVLTGVGWRAEVRASRTITVRGGICADHPGFGKTILSLALVGSDDVEQLRRELPERSGDLFASVATLIVCPGTLIDQWLGEIKECTGSHHGVIVIRQTADLSKFTDAAFEKAKIILLNRSVLSSDSYAERVAALAALPGPALKAGRGFAKWLQYARIKIAEHLDILRLSGSSALKAHIKTRYAAMLENDDLSAMIPSRRLRGKHYESANSKSKAASVLKPASKTIDTAHVEAPLFEKFYFNRIIVDEFHQYESRELATLGGLRADKRWGLSGTPALGDLYDVAQLGKLIGVPLRIGSDARGIMKIRNSRALRTDMTDFEVFEAKRSIPSAPMHVRMHEVSQAFLDTFVRRNQADFTKIQLEEHLLSASLELEHQVVYMELSQHLNSADMRITRGRSAQTEDRDPRVTEIVAMSDTPEEALSRAAAFWRADQKSFGSHELSGLGLLLTRREGIVDDLLVQLRTALKEAQADEPDAFALWKKAKLDQRTIADQQTIDDLTEMGILDASTATCEAQSKLSKKRKPSRNDEDGDEPASGAPPATNPKTSLLNTLGNRLLLANRSLRYARGVQVLQEHIAKKTPLPQCQHPQCAGVGKNDMAVSAFCGHLLCEGCYHNLRTADHDHCPATGCEAILQKYNLLWASKLGGLNSSRRTPYGSKLDKAMDLLGNIRAQHDQAIMFVQYSEQLLEAEQALRDRGVPAFIVKSGESAASQIKDFTAGERTVLVLNASDETSVGLNLQNANHVILLSPLLRDSQYGYDSTKAQTIGRVRRHGQTKAINAYTIFAPHTIDVDILEHREKRTNAIAEWNAAEITPPAAAQSLNMDPTELERTQLVIENGRYSLRPQSWLVRCGADNDSDQVSRVKGRGRVMGWEDVSSLVKFSRAYAEDDD